MNIIILAGGKGLRMLNSFKNKPKQLLKIDNTTIIERIINQVLNQVYIEKIYISVAKCNTVLIDNLNKNHFVGEKLVLINSVDSKGESFSKIFRENAVQIYKHDMLLFMGDTVFIEEEISSFLKEGLKSTFDIILGVTKCIEGFSGMLVDKTTNIQSRLLESNYIHSTGCFYLNKRIFDLIVKYDETSLSKIFNNLISNNTLSIHQYEFKLFFDVNNVKTYQKCIKHIRKNTAHNSKIPGKSGFDASLTGN